MNVPLPIRELPDEEVTIAEFLKSHNPNYATGHFGKWHMGGENAGAARLRRAQRAARPTHPATRVRPTRSVAARSPTRRCVSSAEQAEAGRPFFVQVSYYAVHTPVLARDDTVQAFNDLITPEPPARGPVRTLRQPAPHEHGVRGHDHGTRRRRRTHSRHPRRKRPRGLHVRHLHLGQRRRVRCPRHQQRAACLGQDARLGGRHPRASACPRPGHRGRLAQQPPRHRLRLLRHHRRLGGGIGTPAREPGRRQPARRAHQRRGWAKCNVARSRSSGSTAPTAT